MLTWLLPRPVDLFSSRFTYGRICHSDIHAYTHTEKTECILYLSFNAGGHSILKLNLIHERQGAAKCFLRQ